ncbi:MAG: glycosyltransferase family 4 protein [Myxococcaceae bacterium]|nr:glycosyltransferase family 4 protein [Myxococcaceae bacterium]MCA3012059.1 glycosyltransferase family 4 protein [Myxococcaceae bacterium]
MPQPRLALDASLWDEPVTGIALYGRQLRAALEARGLAVERWGARRSGEQPRRQWSRTGWTLGALPGLLTRERPALYHAIANFNLPLERVAGVPLVLTFHDAVPLLLPETVSRAFRWQFRLWLARAVRVADQVICVSAYARQSLLEVAAVDPAKLHVVRHGVDHVTTVAAPDATTVAWLDALGLPEPFVLYAGALDARKNVELVLAAVERLHEGGRRPTLVLAGQRWFGSGRVEREILRLKARGLDVRHLGYLDDPVFFALMRRAGVFVFPSRAEGFGLPPLEAMRLGVPTIVSDAAALPEVVGDGAWTVGVDDADGLAQRLDRLLGDASLRRSLGEAGRLRASTFTWSRCARETASVYALTGAGRAVEGVEPRPGP